MVPLKVMTRTHKRSGTIAWATLLVMLGVEPACYPGLLGAKQGAAVTADDPHPLHHVFGDVRVGERRLRGRAQFEDRPALLLPENPMKEEDRELKQRVERRFTWTPFVDADYLIVSVRDGVAILNGWVEDDSEMRDAVAQADRAGAKLVVNRLRKLYSHPDIPPPWYWLFPSVWEKEDEDD